MEHDEAIISKALEIIKKKYGNEGIKMFVADLAALQSNNWRMSEKYNLSVVQVIFLRQRWNMLYLRAYKEREVTHLELLRKAG